MTKKIKAPAPYKIEVELYNSSDALDEFLFGKKYQYSLYRYNTILKQYNYMWSGYGRTDKAAADNGLRSLAKHLMARKRREAAKRTIEVTQSEIDKW